MPTNYPASLDSLPRPGPLTEMDDAGFEGDIVIDNISDAIEAIEAKLGTGVGTPPASAAVLRRTATGASGWGQIVNADVASAAAIAYSKLALSNSIVNADVASAAAIAYSKLALSNSIVTADMIAGAVTQRVLLSPIAATSTTSASLAGVTGSFTTFTTTGGDILVLVGVVGLTVTNAAFVNMCIYVDSVNVQNWVYDDMPATTRRSPMGSVLIVGPAAAGHPIGLGWSTTAGTLSFGQAYVTMIELKR